MLRRFQSGPGVWWAWACVAILIAGGLNELSPHPWTLPLGHGLSSLYPALLLCGALRFADRPAPIWLVPALFVFGAARGGAQLLGYHVVAQGAALAVEPWLSVVAAVVVAGAELHGAPTRSQRLLPAALVGIACLDALTALAQLPMGPLPEGLVAAWMLGAPLLLALQLVAWADLSRREFERARELLEQRVLEQHERYRDISELARDYHFSIRVAPGGFVQTEWSTGAARAITGYETAAFEGRGWEKLIHPDDRARVESRFQRILAGEEPGQPLEARCLTRTGELRHVELRLGRMREGDGGEVRMVGAMRDVTERVQAAQERHRLDIQMREMQRLEALGRLAGGIAHDFNNVLTVILGNARLSLEDLDEGTSPRQRLQRIRAAADYAAGLTDQILTYSGKAAVALEPVDLSTLVRDMTDLLEASVSEKTALELHLPQGLPAVEGDLIQLRQLLLNLVINASEALTDEGGTVQVRTGARGVDEQDLGGAIGTSGLDTGHYVFLRVSDSGVGIAPDLRSRVFEPFFTTKASGRGMGLAAVLGIARSHRGAILVEGAPGSGTRIEVLLPRSARQPRPTGRVGRRASRGRGSVLLVDDDPAVLEVGAEFLKRRGFQVHTAAGGREAVEMVRGGDPRVDAVVLDLVMPGFSGEQTFLALREIRPDLPVVLASGYDREHAAERFSARGIAEFVRKPYDPDALVESVRTALARG